MPDMLDRIASQGVAPQGDMLDRIAANPTEEPLWKKALRTAWGGTKFGINALIWPFQRAQYMTATPLAAMLEARHKTQFEQDKPTIGFKTLLPLGTTRQGEFAEVSKAMRPALESLTTWKAPEGVKTFEDVSKQFQKMLLGPTATITKAHPYVAHKYLSTEEKEKLEMSQETMAKIGGFGASVLHDPFVVSKALKGLTVLGKATPMYKTWQAQQLPKLKEMALISRAEKGKRIEDIVRSGKAVGKRPMQKLAKEIFGEKLGKPAQSRKELARQVSALRQRYQTIEKGGIGETLPKLELIDRMKSTGKELQKMGLLGEETFVTKLTRAKRNLYKGRIAALESQVKKLREPTYQKTIGKLVKNLKIKGQEPLANKVVNLIGRLNTAEAKTRNTIISDLVKIADTGKAKGAGITPLIKRSLSARKNLTLLQQVARTKGQKEIISKVLNLANRMKGTPEQGQAALAARMRRIAAEAKRYGLYPLGDFTDDIISVNESLYILSRKSTYVNRVSTLLKDLDTVDLKRSQVIMAELGKIDDKLSHLGIVGVKPLIKKIASMKRRFPGQTAKIKELTDKIDDINLKLWQSEHLGGQLYAPRLYRKFEEAAKRRWPFFSKHRIRRPYAKHRDPTLSLAARKEMGEITEIGYSEIKRQIQAAADIETAKLFNKIGQNIEWVSHKAVEGFKQLPKGKAYGSLAEKWVHPQVQREVAGLIDVRTNAGKILDAFLGTWKGFKVFWSPPTQFRNLGSNAILNDITGTDFAKQIQLLPSAIKHIRGNSDEFQTAWKFFSRAGFARGEILDDLLKMNSSKGSAITKVAQFLPKMSAKPAGLYQREEFIGKFIKYLHMKERGASTIQAVQEANRALFDYSAISAFEKTYLRRTMPFYTFPRKAIPLVLQSMRDNPYAVAKYPLLAEAMTKHSLAKLEISDEDFGQISKDLPKYMERGSYMLLPYRDTNDDLRFFDMTFWMPWGEMADLNQRGALDVVLSNPIYTLSADIQRNKSSFTDQPIWMETDTFSERTAKKFQHFWKLMVPSLTPDIIPGEKWSTGGIYWEKLYDAATGRKGRATIEFPEGKTKPLPETIAHTIFGVRTQAITPKAQKRYDFFDKNEKIKELSGKLKRIYQEKKSNRISEQEYQRLRNQYLQQIRDVWKPNDEMKHLTESELLLKTTR